MLDNILIWRYTVNTDLHPKFESIIRMHPLQIHPDNPVFPEATPHTQRAYRAQWRLFSEWTSRRGMVRLPASPDTVSKYLSNRAKSGSGVSTIRASAAAIAAVHRLYGFRSPTYSRVVRSTLRRLAYRYRRAAVSARPLTDIAVYAIQKGALKRRVGRGGFRERRSMAMRRGKCDVALVRLVSDASLRRSEAAALVWEDVTTLPKGRGLIKIRRAATSSESCERIVVSRDTMRALSAIRSKAATPEMSVFGLSESQIHRRIKAAASAAGLGDGFGGNSGRTARRQPRKRRPLRAIVTSPPPTITANMHRLFTDLVEEATQLSWTPSVPERGSAEPRSDEDETLMRETLPQRLEYPNASPEV